MKRTLDITPNPRRASREPVVPMINVVFLLLIFFLMTAQIQPPAPFDVELPTAEGADKIGETALYINETGDIAFEDTRGTDALSLAAMTAGDAPLRIHADANLAGTSLARVLAQLSLLGVRDVEIVTEGG